MDDYSSMEPDEVQKVLVNHLKENKTYGEGSQAWTIGYSKLGGRGMFATRDIQQGELIFVDVPLLIGPRCKNLRICSCCYKSECPLFPCDRGCGLPVCSVECENSPKHVDYECKYLKSLVPICGTDWSTDLLLALTPIRALFMTDQQRECFAAFQRHKSLFPGYEIDLLCRNVKNSPSKDEIDIMKRVCYAFNTNSFETVSVQDKDHYVSLRGLYPMGALQNHCCVPNTRHHFDENYRVYVSAAFSIPAGEELTMSYTSLLWDTMLRRQFLSVTKHFDCNCKRCSDSTEFGSKLGALFCAGDDCFGHLLPQDPLKSESPWICDICKKSVNYRQICSIRSGLTALVEELLYKSPRQILKIMQRDFSDLIPESNYLMVNMKFRIISYFGRAEGFAWTEVTNEELKVKRTYCNDLLSILDTLNCGYCKKKGIILYELYWTNVELIKRVQSQSINDEHLQLLTQIDADKNECLIEKALKILNNDVLTMSLLKSDKIMH